MTAVTTRSGGRRSPEGPSPGCTEAKSGPQERGFPLVVRSRARTLGSLPKRGDNDSFLQSCWDSGKVPGRRGPAHSLPAPPAPFSHRGLERGLGSAPQNQKRPRRDTGRQASDRVTSAHSGSSFIHPVRHSCWKSYSPAAAEVQAAP